MLGPEQKTNSQKQWADIACAGLGSQAARYLVRPFDPSRLMEAQTQNEENEVYDPGEPTSLRQTHWLDPTLDIYIAASNYQQLPKAG